MLVQISAIKINNVTGPFSIGSGHGKIILSDIKWNQAAAWNGSFFPARTFPYSISSKKAAVDISAPSTLKATMMIKTAEGKVYSDFDINQDLTLNGGGVKLYLENDFGNIYIRKRSN